MAVMLLAQPKRGNREGALEGNRPSIHMDIASAANQWEVQVEQSLYPAMSRELAERRRALAPETEKAFHEFSRQVFAEGALSAKTKQLIAVAVAHVTQCPYCIRGHTKLALRQGATRQELMEAIWVAAEMRAGGAYAHATLAVNAMDEAGHPAAG
jgi:AhpD family alkylhydroperoxidase